jgi:hypothetical protein
MHQIAVMIAVEVWADGAPRPSGKVALLSFDSAAALLRSGKARIASATEIAAAGVAPSMPEIAEPEAVPAPRPARTSFQRLRPAPENN